MVDDTTRKLILRARDQDPEAIEELFGLYRDRLRHAIKRLLGPLYRQAVGDSEDAVQDAMLASFKRLDRFDYRGKGSFLAWLLRSADFQMRTRLRAASTRKRRAENVQPLVPDDQIPHPGAATPSEVLAGREHEREVIDGLDQLPQREREIILLRRYLDLPMEEICQELDLPTPGAARALLSRAQARLAALMTR